MISKAWLDKQSIPRDFIFHPIGLAHFNGTAYFDLPSGHCVSFAMSHGSSKSIKGEVKTLKAILEELQHDTMEILKIDIEGAEFDVIDDICDVSSRIGQLLIEFHHRMKGPNGACQMVAAVEKLRSAGFALFYVSERGLEFCFLNLRIQKNLAVSMNHKNQKFLRRMDMA